VTEAPEPEVRPLEGDVPRLVAIGTALWLVALLVLLALHTRLRADGHTWFIAVAAVGAGLGLPGFALSVRWRRRALAHGAELLPGRRH